jgi:alpha-tubulin suppressor-like RCC1 family protein
MSLYKKLISGGEKVEDIVFEPGVLYTWGSLSNNLSADTETTFLGGDFRGSPGQIGSQSWSQICYGSTYAIAIRTDGLLFAWGKSNDGALGIGESDVVNLPSVNNFSWSQVSSGEGHTLAIRSDGKLFAWGLNFDGQVGDGTSSLFSSNEGRSSPVQIGNSSWSQVSAGFLYSLAIRSDGALFGWGRNSSGVLGDGTIIDKSSPVQIGTSSWSQISAGTSHSAAIRSDGRLFTWGRNNRGQLGDGTIIDKSSPVQIGTSSWTQVSVKSFTTLAIRLGGSLFGWGLNSTGSIGLDIIPASDPPAPGELENLNSRSSPTQVGTFSWTQISTSGGHSAAIRSDARLFTAGNATDALARPDTSANTNFNEVSIGGSWTQISVQSGITSAIRSDNKLFHAGINRSGLFNIPTIPVNTSVNVLTEASYGGLSYSKVSTSSSHSAFITTNNKLFMMGRNLSGQLGDSTTSDKSTILASPVYSPVQIGTSSWKQVSLINNHILAIKNDDTLWAWGNNTSGQLGDSTTSVLSIPTQISSDSWSKISAGYSHSLAIKSNKTLWGWGLGSSFQLFQENAATTTLSWSQISLGLTHTLAIRSDGLLFSWGANAAGQLGTGNRIDRSSPVQVGSLSWSKVSAGTSHSLAIRSDGTLWAWGLATGGRLGTGNNTSRSSPVQVGSLSWTEISAGFEHSAGIRNNGLLFAWGLGASGKLGAGNTTNRSSPVIIGALSWSKVSVNGQHSLAIRNDGLLFSWGGNAVGQLGDSTITNKSSPVQLGSDTWSDVSAGNSHSAAIRSDGALFTWGENDNGRLGLGFTIDNINISSPTQVGSLSWSQVSAGLLHTVARTTDGILYSFGGNASGQLGTGNTTEVSDPTQVGTSSWSQVAAGTSHTAAIGNDGILHTWGLGSSGQLGNTDELQNFSSPTIVGNNIFIIPLNTSSPVQLGSSLWKNISAAEFHNLGIGNNNKLYTWGTNASGRLGSSQLVHKVPTIIASDKNWSYVSAGRLNSAGITSRRSLYVWGENGDGQLADGTRADRSSPVQVGTSSWIQVSVGPQHMSAITVDNKLFAWGENNNGELGQFGNTGPAYSWSQVYTTTYYGASDGVGSTFLGLRSDGLLFFAGDNRSTFLNIPSNTAVYSPVQVGTSSWSKVAMSFLGSDTIRPSVMGISNDGLLYGYGSNGFGQLGNGTTSSITGTSFVQIGSDTWSDVKVGYNFTVAIKSDGTLWAWGFNGYYNLGDGTIIDKSSPVQIGTSSWKQISVVDSSVLAIRNDDTLWAWGVNTAGQLGIWNTDLETYSWSQIALTGYNSVAIRSDGALWTWGGNDFGLNGNNLSGGTFDRAGNTSKPSNLGTNSWSQISSGFFHNLAIRSDGTLWSWGDAAGGRLGNGSTFNSRSSPVQVGTSSWTQISAGTYHSLGITSDGGLFAWGSNSTGALGFGDTLNRTSPAKLGTDSWIFVNASKTFDPANISSFAIRLGGSLFSWGSNGFGQLGDGTIISRSSPVQVGTSSWNQVSSGTGHVLAIRSGGSLFTWGNNNNGQLGSGTITLRSSPVQVGSSSWTQVSAALDSSIARSGFRLFSWGSNSFYQLGLNDKNNRSSPVQVGTSSWVQIGTNGYTGAGITTANKLYYWGSFFDGIAGDVRGHDPEISWDDTLNPYKVPKLAFSEIKFPLQSFISVPTQVGTSTWTKIGTNGDSFTGALSYAIRSDNKLFVFGSNKSDYNDIISDGHSHFKLGIKDDAILQASPVQVGTSSWTQVYTSTTQSTLFLRHDGKLFKFPQYMTVEDNSPSNPPFVIDNNMNHVQVNDLNWSEIYGPISEEITGSTYPSYIFQDGLRSVLLKDTNNLLYTTGISIAGNKLRYTIENPKLIGNNTVTFTDSRSSPVQIGTDSWTQVNAGNNNTMGLKK